MGTGHHFGDDPVSRFEKLTALLRVRELSPEQEAALEAFGREMRSHFREGQLRRIRYELLFDAAPDPYVVTDRDGVITEMNAAARELLGLDETPSVVRDLAGFIAEEERDRYFAWLAMLRSGLPEVRWDTELTVPDPPHRIPVEVSLADDLDLIGHRWLIRDQRERVAAENLLREVAEREHRAAMELRGEAEVNAHFLRTLAHDLRGPIGALVHQAELLTGVELSPEVRDRSRAAVEDNTVVLKQLLEMLVDIERYASGDLDVRSAPTTLSALVDPLRRASDRVLRVGAVDSSVVIDVDVGVMQRALLTLVNAMTDTSDGRVDVDIDLSGSQVHLRFSSNDRSSLSDDAIALRLARALIGMHAGTLHYSRTATGHAATVTLPAEATSEQ